MTVLRSKELLEKYEALSEPQKEAISALVEQQWTERRVPERPEAKQTHRVVGRLVFEYDQSDGTPKPLHNMPLELWDRDIGNPDDYLARGQTNKNGAFEIWYDPTDVDFKDAPDLELRVFEAHHVYRRNGDLRTTLRLIHTIKGDDDVTAQTYDFGVCRVPYWEYDPMTPTPRVLIVEQGDPPQAYEPGRSLTMVKAIAPLEFAKRKHLLINKLDADKPTLQDIQDDYPENLTRQLEREHPGYTRSDEFFGERMLNGMTASILDQDPGQPNRYWLYHQWNGYEQDGVHALPNVDIRFEIRQERLYPVQITLKQRQPGQTTPNAPTQTITLTPADGDQWMQAKRVARMSAALLAELDAHLTTTHLNVEQYAIAAYRNLRENPLRVLLFPHLKEVCLINHTANTHLLGETGHITRASALTAESLNQRIRDVLGTLDWKNWRPRKVLTRRHLYARAAHLFWDILTEYVDAFFAQHQDEIVRHWYEIHLFSQELVDHSVPFFLCSYLRRKLLPSQDDSNPPPHTDWFAPEERMDVGLPRVKINGEEKAIQPITWSDTPSDEDIDNLKQVCRYVIMHATFMHYWPNARQYDDGGEILYTSLGLRYGDHGILAPETDLSIAPTPLIATEQLWIMAFLSKSAYGFIVKNAEHDIHPALIEALRSKKAAFRELGLDIEQVQSRINI